MERSPPEDRATATPEKVFLVRHGHSQRQRERTFRGQTARFNAGFATGAVAFGFCTTPKLDAVGQVLAHVISADEVQATVVRGIFSEYLAGRSIAQTSLGSYACPLLPVDWFR